MATEEPDVWEIRLSGSERGRSSTGVWTRYGGTAAKAGGQQRTQTSSCSFGRLLPTRSEVYRAKDRKLGREVAIKVLPEAFAQNEERLARYMAQLGLERRAKPVPSLMEYLQRRDSTSLRTSGSPRPLRKAACSSGALHSRRAQAEGR